MRGGGGFAGFVLVSLVVENGAGEVAEVAADLEVVVGWAVAFFEVGQGDRNRLGRAVPSEAVFLVANNEQGTASGQSDDGYSDAHSFPFDNVWPWYPGSAGAATSYHE